MKNVLVTGGAGFIGSHIVDGYIKEGWRVTVVDNLFRGKKENLNPQAKFYQLDMYHFPSFLLNCNSLLNIENKLLYFFDTIPKRFFLIRVEIIPLL